MARGGAPAPGCELAAASHGSLGSPPQHAIGAMALCHINLDSNRTASP